MNWSTYTYKNLYVEFKMCISVFLLRRLCDHINTELHCKYVGMKSHPSETAGFDAYESIGFCLRTVCVLLCSVGAYFECSILQY